ncbi:MerR family transcriptional regulator [Culicoidibacter larvae]|uniref:MerR family transcriptional regulator n=1 Tax=Culicoidibacter larvae TaxID=2579976 RepID=A0A5R8Q8Z5_9FIRM|nr:MerR family transcriptional regulator [Culicoidibacter larvae]TLG72115.1 MerR family transcriptional regulator [Culicoidibacter larvae]
MKRPIDIARALNISTSSLRHYEDWQMIPAVERTANGYRIYNEEHIAYFTCIRLMAPGFGIKLTGEIMRLLMTSNHSQALWRINEEQAKLHNEKIIAEKALEHIARATIFTQTQNRYTIGEVSKKTGIPASTIRFWEKIRLLELEREPSSRYRLFTNEHISRIFVIHALNTSIYSPTYSLAGIQDLLHELDFNDSERIQKITDDFISHLETINYYQTSGIAGLHDLITFLGLGKPRLISTNSMKEQ